MEGQVVLAYTGGLESSVSLHWLQHRRNLRVIGFSANLGMAEEALEEIGELALAGGAQAAHVVDLRERFAEEFLAPAIRANARYEQGYFLGVAMSRAMIVREMVKIAIEDGCDYLAHGGMRSGNDRIRFEAAVKELAPDLKVISPVLEWTLRTRQDEEDYAKRHQIRHRSRTQRGYNFDDNMWGRTVRWDGGEEDPWSVPPKDAFLLTADPTEAPDGPEELTIRFDGGLPVAVNEQALPLVQIVERLNSIGGRHGVGRFDMLEHRVTGEKLRQVYESPAAYLVVTSHEALEYLILDKDTLLVARNLSQRYSDLVYRGLWFHPLREALAAFFTSIQAGVQGEVRLRLYKGSCRVVGRRELSGGFAGDAP